MLNSDLSPAAPQGGMEPPTDRFSDFMSMHTNNNVEMWEVL